jgi:anaerobic selenocysteine-containing dehydrogenase
LQRTGCVPLPWRAGSSPDAPFATRTGKVELFSETLREAGLDPLPAYVPPTRETQPATVRADYPLILLTGDREKSYHHSRFREQAWAKKVSPDPILLVHPDTARALSVTDGAWVTVDVPNGPGGCRLRAKVTDRTPPGVVSTGMGWWRPHSMAPDHGALDININAALPYEGRFDPASGSVDTRGLLCRVRATHV